MSLAQWDEPHPPRVRELPETPVVALQRQPLLLPRELQALAEVRRPVPYWPRVDEKDVADVMERQVEDPLP